ncbi:MFS transporter [Aquamicrobium ahrensii]|uniref:MFS transporter n=1 Tax=Aquamicrobium ahrensii TaxID=469551 RepID=UPI0033956EEF
MTFSGFWMQKTAIGWLTWELTHSPAWVGTIALSDLIASLWVAPLSGVLTDRSNPYRLIWTTQLAVMANAILLWLLVVTHAITPWLLLGWAIADATLQGFNLPVRLLVTGSLATRGKMNQAIAISSIAVNLARSTGPALAGIIMLGAGADYAILANILTFPVMFLALLRIRRVIDRPRAETARTSFTSELSQGLSYVTRTPKIGLLFTVVVMFSLLARPFIELFPAIAGGVFHGGPGTLAMLMTSQGIGALFGAAWMLRSREPMALVRTTFAAAFGIGVALVCFSWIADVTYAYIAIGFAGLFHVITNIGMQSMTQTMSREGMLGRVLALYGLLFKIGPSAGAFLIGFGAHWIDLQILIGVSAAIFAGAIVMLWPALRRTYGY